MRALEAFYKMMKHEQSRAFYGPKHVFAAAGADAVEILLISDKLFRANKVSERRKYVDLVDKVCHIFRSRKHNFELFTFKLEETGTWGNFLMTMILPYKDKRYLKLSMNSYLPLCVHFYFACQM